MKGLLGVADFQGLRQVISKKRGGKKKEKRKWKIKRAKNSSNENKFTKRHFAKLEKLTTNN